MTNKFHDHLDVCKQCADQPFNLCPVGAAALQRAATEPLTTHDDTDRPFFEAVYDVLVEHGGTLKDPRDKETFVRYFTQREHRGNEYRCVHALGFGGKFWRNAGRFYVNYYLDERTKKLDAIEAKLNALIIELVEKMKPNPDGPGKWPS